MLTKEMMMKRLMIQTGVEELSKKGKGGVKGKGRPQSKIRVANDCQNPIFKMFLKIPSKIIVHINIIKGATKW